MKWKFTFLFNLFIFILLAGNPVWAESPDDVTDATQLPPDILNPPPLNANGKIPVTLTFELINLSDIDEVEQHFNVVGYLVATWKDPRLAYVQKNSVEEYRTYQPGKIWQPLFDFVNGVVPHSAYDITLRVFPDGKVLYFERSSATLSNDLYLHRFPFDKQSLKIQIQPSVSQENIVELSPRKASSTKKAFTAEPIAYSGLSQWVVTDLTAESIQVKGLLNESVNVVEFSINITRQTGFYILKVFIPLFMMVVLSWTVFWIDPKELDSQIAVAITVILTVIAFSFSITTSLPKVPYLTFIDAFFLCCYTFVFITATVITAIHVLRNQKLEHIGKKTQHLSQVVLPTLFFIILLMMIIGYHLL